MKMTITENEVFALTGKFILQVNSDQPESTITEANWHFIKEKRLAFVSELSLVGFYGEHHKFDNKADFVEYFNNYIGTSKGCRFHRLLTNKEIDFVCNKLKQENY